MKNIYLSIGLTLIILNGWSQNFLFEIPDNSFLVVRSTGAAYEKGDFEKSLELPLMKEVLKEIARESRYESDAVLLTKFLADPKNTGMDFSKEMVFYGAVNDSSFEFGGIAYLKDRKAFEHYLYAFQEQADSFFVSDQQAIVGNAILEWNDSKVWMAAGVFAEVYVPWWERQDHYKATEEAAEEAYTEEESAYEEGMAYEESPEERLERIEEQERQYEIERQKRLEREEQERLERERKWELERKRMLELDLQMTRQAMDRLKKVSSKNAWSTNDNFKKHFTSQSDLSFFVSAPEVSDRLKRSMRSDEAYMTSLLLNNFQEFAYGVDLNFEDTQIKLEFKQYLGDELKGSMKTVNDASIDKSLFKYIKGDDLFAFAGYSVNLDGVFDVYKSLKVPVIEDEIGFNASKGIKPILNLLDLIIDEESIGDLIRGGAILAFTGEKQFEITRYEYEYDEEYNYQEIETVDSVSFPTFVFALNSDKIEAWEDILSLFEMGASIEKTNDMWLFKTRRLFPVMAKIDGDNLVISNDDELMNSKINTGYGKNAMSKEDQKLLKTNNAVFKFDTEKAFGVLAKSSPELTSSPRFAPFLDIPNQIKKLTLSGNSMKGNVMSSETILELNSEENSLKFLIEFLNDLFIGPEDGYGSIYEETSEETIEIMEEAIEEDVEEEAVEEEVDYAE